MLDRLSIRSEMNLCLSFALLCFRDRWLNFLMNPFISEMESLHSEMMESTCESFLFYKEFMERSREVFRLGNLLEFIERFRLCKSLFQVDFWGPNANFIGAIVENFLTKWGLWIFHGLTLLFGFISLSLKNFFEFPNFYCPARYDLISSYLIAFFVFF